MLLRSAVKPECISATTERAKARAARSLGQSLASGNSSFSVSTIASESQMPSVPSIRYGTLPLGEWRLICSRQSGSPNEMKISW
jgi:hypothetical protein